MLKCWKEEILVNNFAHMTSLDFSFGTIINVSFLFNRDDNPSSKFVLTYGSLHKLYDIYYKNVIVYRVLTQRFFDMNKSNNFFCIVTQTLTSDSSQ